MLCLVVQVCLQIPKSFYGELEPAKNDEKKSYELCNKGENDNVKAIDIMMDDMLLPCQLRCRWSCR